MSATICEVLPGITPPRSPEEHVSAARLAGILDSAMDAIIAIDANQQITLFNRAAEQIFGCPASEALGRPLDRFIPERFREAHREHIRTFGRTHITSRSMHSPGTLVALRADGEEFPIEATISQVEADGEKLYTVIMRDMTERKRAEEERARAEARQRGLETALEHEREIVHTLAESFLGKVPRIPGLQVEAIYEPASKADRMGGDFFDFITLAPHGIGVVVGDVCGKGLPAALYTATTRSMLRAYALEDAEPERVLSRLNRALYHELTGETTFVTLFYGVLDLEAGILTYACAGHPPPVLCDPASGCCERLRVTGGIVGAFAEMPHRQGATSLPPGAVLAIFTDGVSEAAGTADPLGDAGVSEILQARAAESAGTIAQAILQRARDLAGGDLRDDVAAVVIRRT